MTAFEGVAQRALAGLVFALLAGCGHGLGPFAEQRPGPPDPVALRLGLARTLIDHGDFDAAVAPLRSVLAQHPGNVEAHVLLAMAYRERALLVAAERELQEALRLDERAAAAHGELGILYDRTGRSAQALDEHAQAVRFGASVAAWHNNLGFSLYLTGRHAEAAAELEAALQIDPSLRRSRNNLGFALGALGDLRAALRAFEASGTPAEAHNNLGQVYERRGDAVAACASYHRAGELDPGLAAASRNAARLCPTREPKETTRR